MKTFFAGICASAVLIGSSNAVTVNLFPIDRGWFDSNDQSLGTTDDNYVAGEAGTEAQLQGGGGREFRNFFVFDLSGIGAGLVLGGTLKLLNPNVSEDLLGEPLPGDNDPIIGNGFYSNDPSETYAVTSYTLPGGTSVTDLVDGTPALGIYANLGTGAAYGSVVVTSLDNPSVINIGLNPTFVTDANAAAGVGRLIIGGRVTTLDGDLTDTEWVFAWTDLDPTTYTPADGKVVLTLELIPEPSSIGLAGLGVLLCAFRRRRKS